jgi:peptidoglycan LD-endopeptidase CwlK
MRAHDDMLMETGYQILCNQGLRTWEQQEAIFAQGRTKPGKIVSWAPAGYSWHNFGLALDAYFAGKDPYLEFAIRDADERYRKSKTAANRKALDFACAEFERLWKAWGECGKRHGLAWGGDWPAKRKDRPHHEYTRGMSLKEARALYKEGGLNSVWDRVDEITQLINQNSH